MEAEDEEPATQEDPFSAHESNEPATQEETWRLMDAVFCAWIEDESGYAEVEWRLADAACFAHGYMEGRAKDVRIALGSRRAPRRARATYLWQFGMRLRSAERARPRRAESAAETRREAEPEATAAAVSRASTSSAGHPTPHSGAEFRENIFIVATQQ